MTTSGIGLALSGLNAAQRFDRLMSAAGGFSTDPELAGCGNCFFFSILGHAHDLFVALPGLTDTELAREASEVVQAIEGLPEEYLPTQDPEAEHDAYADTAPENEPVRLHDYFAAALIAVQGWFIGAYAPPSDESLSETHHSEADKKRFAEFEKQQDPGWEPSPGGSCNFVMAE